jgi:hypothetical protein
MLNNSSFNESSLTESQQLVLNTALNYNISEILNVMFNTLKPLHLKEPTKEQQMTAVSTVIKIVDSCDNPAISTKQYTNLIHEYAALIANTDTNKFILSASNLRLMRIAFPKYLTTTLNINSYSTSYDCGAIKSFVHEKLSNFKEQVNNTLKEPNINFREKVDEIIDNCFPIQV